MENDNNILKPTCASKAGRVLFYLFEIAALIVGFVCFIEGIIGAVQAGSFLVFLRGLLNTAIYTLILYGIGRVIDLLYNLNETV